MNLTQAAKRLSQLRAKQNYSQMGMAKIAEVDQTTVGNWERGLIPKQWKSLIALAEKFNVSTDYLLGLIDDPTAARDIQTDDPVLAELIDLIQQMDADQRQQLAGIARVLVGTPHIIE